MKLIFYEIDSSIIVFNRFSHEYFFEIGLKNDSIENGDVVVGDDDDVVGDVDGDGDVDVDDDVDDDVVDPVDADPVDNDSCE